MNTACVVVVVGTVVEVVVARARSPIFTDHADAHVFALGNNLVVEVLVRRARVLRNIEHFGAATRCGRRRRKARREDKAGRRGRGSGWRAGGGIRRVTATVGHDNDNDGSGDHKRHTTSYPCEKSVADFLLGWRAVGEWKLFFCL